MKSRLFFGRLALPSWVIILGIMTPMISKPAKLNGEDRLPNIVIIYADDLGYGDIGCYGAKQVKTPNIDRLAKDSLRFTDAHSQAATCTPSRYSLLTGEYAWRKKGTDILPGNANLIIAPGRTTLPGMLQKAGYQTGVVGKWHLGLGNKDLDWNKEIKPGPLEIGFNSCFLVPATGDRVPCVYVENHRVYNLDPADPIQISYNKPLEGEPTGKDHPELLKMKLSHGHDQTIINGISRIGYMTGGKKARWVDEDMADVLTNQANQFIEKNKNKPFFLYFATHDIHVPRVPHQRFKGKSQCGIRGDAIEQLDDCVGRVLATLEKNHLTSNTIVIFSSDNGPVLDDGYADRAVQDLGNHKPAGALRGGKYSRYEGGTRVPFLIRWPEKIKPGVSTALICQIDLLASLATLVKQKLSPEAAPDSMDVLAALLGNSQQGRDILIEQGNGLQVRKGNWKYIPANLPKKKKAKFTAELYDLQADLGEKKNLAQEHPEKVKELHTILETIQKQGRSRTP